MREIRTSGSMSGAGKRDHGAPGVQSTRARPRLYPNGEARRGARLLAGRVGLRADVVSTQSVEYREQAQRSNGGLIACFDRQAVRKAG